MMHVNIKRHYKIKYTDIVVILKIEDWFYIQEDDSIIYYKLFEKQYTDNDTRNLFTTQLSKDNLQLFRSMLYENNIDNVLYEGNNPIYGKRFGNNQYYVFAAKPKSKVKESQEKIETLDKKKTCNSCMLMVNDKCNGSSSICEDYKERYMVDFEDRESWPSYEDNKKNRLKDFKK